MASTLKVNEIQHTGGTTGITIDSNGVVSQPNTVIPAACYSYSGADIVAAAIIPLNAATVLQGGMTISSNAITVPQTGLYQIGFYHLANNASSNGNVHARVQIRINGVVDAILPHGWTQQHKPTANNNSFAFSTIASLSANNTVDFYCDGGAVHGNADYNSMYVYKIG
tara:strand:+ start:24 stop:527 length:504 start_codon:yes stop_codon:yes gene_type:complete